MATMKAARYHGAKDIRIEEISIPSVKQNQVKIEVKYVGICGTDLHEYLHGPMVVPMEKAYPLNGHCGVTILGHEFSGVVVEVGENVNKNQAKIGDRVVVEPIFRNSASVFTAKGEYNLSEPLGCIGLMADGAFAKYVVVEDYMVYKIPDSVTFEQGALVEPAAVALYAIKTGNLRIGETCAIFGAGPIGLLCLQAAKAAGAARIIVIDIAEKRLEKARELGASLIIHGHEKDISEKIKAYTDNLGVDVYIDAAGVQSTFNTGIASLKNGGRAILVALFGQPVMMNASDIVMRQISIQGVVCYRHVFPEVIQLIDNKQLDVERLITRKIKLDRIVQDGFEVLAIDPAEIKILIDMTAD